jgi:hypothetical protein
MKWIFILTALLISFTTFSQSVSLNELIILSNSNDDYFDTYATKKGYTFYKADEDHEDDFANSISYSFLVNGIRTAYLIKYNYKHKDGGWVELQTSNSNTYLKLKESLKVNGFSFYDKGVHGESSWIRYKKGKTSVRILSSSDYNEFTRTTTPSYEISVTQNAFQ